MGGFCVLKRRNFEFERLVFYRRKRGKKQTIPEAQTNAQRALLSKKRGRLRCFFRVCVSKEKSDIPSLWLFSAFFALPLFLFSPTYSHTLCARRKITYIHKERGLRKERTFHDARNNTTIIRSRERDWSRRLISDRFTNLITHRKKSKWLLWGKPRWTP